MYLPTDNGTKASDPSGPQDADKSGERGCLVIELKEGESVDIGGINFEIADFRGRRAKIRIKAPKSIRIVRNCK